MIGKESDRTTKMVVKKAWVLQLPITTIVDIVENASGDIKGYDILSVLAMDWVVVLKRRNGDLYAHGFSNKVEAAAYVGDQYGNFDQDVLEVFSEGRSVDFRVSVNVRFDGEIANHDEFNQNDTDDEESTEQAQS